MLQRGKSSLLRAIYDVLRRHVLPAPSDVLRQQLLFARAGMHRRRDRHLLFGGQVLREPVLHRCGELHRRKVLPGVWNRLLLA
jgi:hypothetical protein